VNLARFRAVAGALALLGFVLSSVPAFADRLHLENGGVIQTNSWWIEGDWLHYEGDGGTFGLPRSMVLRIEELTGDADRAPKPEAAPLAHKANSRSEEAAADPRIRIAEAHAALERRDYQTASDLYLAILEIHPEAHGARIGYAVTEMALGRDGIALSVILDGLAREPRRAEFHELLGDLRNREERVDQALREWQEAFKLEPTDRVREKILKGQREMHAGGDYDLGTTVHFNVRYDGDVDRSLAREVMDYLEVQYWELSDRLRHAPPQPITVLLYPTRDFREVTRSPEWVGGLYDGKIRVPLGGLSRLDDRAKGVLAHELTHAVVHSKTRGHCPRWLHEGLAQLADGRRATRADGREVAKLLSTGPPERWAAGGFSYPAALSLTNYLVEQRGFDGLVWTLESLAKGADIDAALRRTYGFDYVAICGRWAETIQGAAAR